MQANFYTSLINIYVYHQQVSGWPEKLNRMKIYRQIRLQYLKLPADSVFAVKYSFI